MTRRRLPKQAPPVSADPSGRRPADAMEDTARRLLDLENDPGGQDGPVVRFLARAAARAGIWLAGQARYAEAMSPARDRRQQGPRWPVYFAIAALIVSGVLALIYLAPPGTWNG